MTALAWMSPQISVRRCSCVSRRAEGCKVLRASQARASRPIAKGNVLVLPFGV